MKDSLWTKQTDYICKICGGTIEESDYGSETVREVEKHEYEHSTMYLKLKAVFDV